MKGTESGAGRMEWLDALRGLAILFVVLGHIPGCPHGLRVLAASFQIPLFYAITGLLAGLRGDADGAPLPSLARRARRLLWPYATFSALSIAYNLGAYGGEAALDALRRTLMLEGVATLWFLPACFLAECVFLTLRKAVSGCGGRLACAAGLAVACALASRWLYWHTGCVDPLTVGARYWGTTMAVRACFGACFMLLGEAAAAQAGRVRAMDGRRLAAGIGAMLLSGGVCALLCGMADPHYGWLGRPALYFPAALLLCSGLAAAFCRWGRGRRLMAFFGRGSLTVMATHYPLPVLRYAALAPRALGLGGLWAVALEFALAMAVEAGLVLAVDRWIPFMLRPPRLSRRAQPGRGSI